MNENRAYLKELASRSADEWARKPCPATWTGETRAETKNTIYHFRDGTCVTVSRREAECRTNPAELVGMRLIGWLSPRRPGAGLSHAWTPGAYAVLWRSRGADEGARSEEAAVALTSATHTCVTARPHSGLVRSARPTVPRPSRPKLPRPDAPRRSNIPSAPAT
jgi:hypothetical protein